MLGMMRCEGGRWMFCLLGLFAACNGESGGEGGAGAAGGARAGTAGASGTAALGGAPGASGSGGASAGATNDAGGTAGRGTVAGSAGVSLAGTGGASLAGAAGTSQAGGGATSVAGTAGRGGTTAGAGATGGAGSGGQDASGGQNASGEAGETAAAGASGAAGEANEPVGLVWPIDCIPEQTCVRIGYPDIDGDGDAHDCSEPGYVGHEGTDIDITFEAQEAGTAVRAAADGTVLFAFDGKYDECPNANEPDCQDPPGIAPGSMTGNTVCTPSGPYCGTGQGDCFWCFAGGNVIVIRHESVPGVFATRYDHLKKNSVRVQPGDRVTRGEQIAEAASAGSSTRPHLHFEVWGTGFYELAEPWAGACGPNTGPSLWAYDPPWSG
jgi:murein DD-endopeptidase MepM/ murein hydrolase activator NlpD